MSKKHLEIALKDPKQNRTMQQDEWDDDDDTDDDDDDDDFLMDVDGGGL